MHFGFDPGLGTRIDLLRRESHGIYRWADADQNLSRSFDKGISRPELSGIVCHRNHPGPRSACEIGASDLVALLRTDRNPCSLWKYNNPETLLESTPSLFLDLRQRIFSG